MPGELLTFQKLNNEAIAQDIITLLSENNVIHEVEDSSNMFDPTFSPSSILREIRIKLHPEDFEKAWQLLANHYQSLLDAVELNSVDPDYFLFSFSDQELMEIMQKPDEWGNFNYQLAQKILSSRGKEVRPEDAEQLRVYRNNQLARPERTNNWMLIVGYSLAVLGGLFGLFIGWHLSYSKKTLPDGRSVYRYNENERDHGTYILIIGCVALVSILVKRILSAGD